MTTTGSSRCCGCTGHASDSQPLDVGTAAPNLRWTDAVGTPAGLHALRGSPVIVTFLGTDWDPARAEFLARYDEALHELTVTPDNVIAPVARVHFEGDFCRVGLADDSEVRSAILNERDLPGDAACQFGVAGRRAVFVIDGAGIIRWRFVAPDGGYPQPDAVRNALRNALAPAANSAVSAAPTAGVGLGMTRRDFVATAFAAAVAFALVPMAETRARAQDGVAAPGVAAPTALSHGIPVTLQINGAAHTLDLDPRVTLLDALREYAGMTGSKKGCDHGQCGACTVHIEGRRVNSCLTLAIAAQGKAITTIEGLATGDTLHPMQASFLKHDGFQCGYCTPGQIMSAVALINEGYAKSRNDVRELMSGNICRCGAYPNIVDAVEEIRNGGKPTANIPGERNDTHHVPV